MSKDDVDVPSACVFLQGDEHKYFLPSGRPCCPQMVSGQRHGKDMPKVLHHAGQKQYRALKALCVTTHPNEA